MNSNINQFILYPFLIKISFYHQMIKDTPKYLKLEKRSIFLFKIENKNLQRIRRFLFSTFLPRLSYQRNLRRSCSLRHPSFTVLRLSSHWSVTASPSISVFFFIQVQQLSGFHCQYVFIVIPSSLNTKFKILLTNIQSSLISKCLQLLNQGPVWINTLFCSYFYYTR